jgi:hypothetical protein
MWWFKGTQQTHKAVVFAAAAGDDDGGDDDGDGDDDGHNGFANENVDEDGELAAEARVPRTLQKSYHNGTIGECVSRVTIDVLSQMVAAPSQGTATGGS